MTRPIPGLPATTSSTSWPLSRWSVAAGPLGGQGVVRDHDDRLLELAIEQLEQVEDLAGGGAVEVAGRLVGDEQVGVGDDRPGDGHALFLAAGELARIVVLASLRPTIRSAVITFSPPLAPREVGQQAAAARRSRRRSGPGSGYRSGR